MESSFFSQSNIMFAIGLLAVLFSIYNYFKKPQDDFEIKQVINEKEVGTKATILAQKEAEGKAGLLALEVQREKEYNTKKFVELTERFDKLDRKMEELTKTINQMNLSLSKQLMQVATIVSEHIKLM